MLDDLLEEEDENSEANVNDINNNINKDIAIIGMAISLPEAENIDQFYSNLKDGVCSINEFPEERKEDVIRYFKYKKGKEYECEFEKGGYLGEIDKFDYGFFRMTPKEASLMNPLQRIFLEACWNAIEDAGYSGKRIASSNTGVYLGHIGDLEGYKYKEMIIETESKENLEISMAGNLSSIIPSRISYILDLKGPSMAVDTACSSSLMALHTAVKALRSNECDMAIAGGIRISLFPVKDGIKIGMESSDGVSRTFDDSSTGTGVGEGVIAMLLKPLGNAIADRDNIHAVIKGSAANQDGRTMGITAPNSKAQTDVILKAWNDASIDPQTISYIEAHGTGTKIGDPIEIDGIENAFRRYTDRRQFCAVSSVKTNIGHLYGASGLAGIVKAIISLKKKQLLPGIHFNTPNHRINFVDSPVYVNDRLTDWKTEGFPRRCGISSFGFSGTNCHVILEEAPTIVAEENKHSNGLDIFTLSAKSARALSNMLQSYKEFLNTNADMEIKLQDICYTANSGRNSYSCRIAFTVDSLEKFTQKINELCDNDIQNLDIPWAYYYEHKVVSVATEAKKENELTEMEVKVLSAEADIKIQKFSEESQNHIAEELCRLYVKGAEIDWKEFYKDSTARKISLPLYPFQKNRCWIEMPAFDCSEDKQNNYYCMNWRQGELLSQRELNPNGTVLLLTNGNPKAERLIGLMRRNGIRVISVSKGKSFLKIDDENFYVGNKADDYENLIENIGNCNISYILHMFLFNSHSEVDSIFTLKEAQEDGVMSLFHISKAIIRKGITSKIKIAVCMDSTFLVDSSEAILRPENSMACGFARVIANEYPYLECKCIDVDNSITEEQILTELADDTNIYISAYRRGKRYIEEFSSLKVDDYHNKNLNIKSDGIYIITGGTGGIGLEMAKFLARRNNCNIALINRTKMPEASLWDGIVTEAKDKKLCSKIKTIKEIEALGSKVKCISLDITNTDDTESTFNNLRSIYGRINGVIQGAGIAGEGLIINKSEDKFREVLSSKVFGTWNLYSSTKEDKPDFFIMFSSGLSMIGQPGQGDYSSANAYLDAFAAFMRSQGRNALTINWVAWEETGMAYEHGFTGKESLFKDITTQKAIEAFEVIFDKDLEKVLIGEMNFDSPLIKMLDKLPFKIAPDLTIGKKNDNKLAQGIKEKVYSEVKIKGRDNNEYSNTERKIAQFCREILGFEEVGVDDNLLEIGADSIALSRVHERIEAEYPGKITMSQIFVYPTVEKLAHYISDKEEPAKVEAGKVLERENRNTDDKAVEDEINSLIDMLESNDINIDDAVNLINNI